MRDQLNHSGMQLVFIADRRGAAFQVADVSAFVGDDQCAFELPGVRRIDAEVRDSSMGHRTPLGTYTNEPSLKTAEFSAAKKLSVTGTTLPSIS